MYPENTDARIAQLQEQLEKLSLEPYGKSYTSMLTIVNLLAGLKNIRQDPSSGSGDSSSGSRDSSNIYSNRAALIAGPTPSTTATATLLGFYAPGDCSIPLFVWSASSTRNDIFAVKPSTVTGAGRWLMQPQSEYDIRWAGAKLDGTTDDSNALLAVADLSINVAIPLGKALLLKPIPLLKCSLIGKTSSAGIKLGAVISTTNVVDDALIILDNNVRIENISFDFSTYSGTSDFLLNFEEKSNIVIKKNAMIGVSVANNSSFSHLLRGDGAINPVIAENIIENFRAEPLRMANTVNAEIKNNIFKNIQLDSRNLNRCILIGNSRSYIISENVFTDIGNLDPTVEYGATCIDVGSALNGLVTNNQADNVHTFMDMESYQDEMHYALIVSNNRISGLRKNTPTARGYGLWINAPKNVRDIQLINNNVSYFEIGIYGLVAAEIDVSGNFITDCQQAVLATSLWDWSCIGNFIRRCVNGISYSANSNGYCGAEISGNSFIAITTNALEINVNGGKQPSDLVNVTGNFFKSGAVIYNNSHFIFESGNVSPEKKVSGATPKIFGTAHAYTDNSSPTTITAIDIPWGQSVTFVINDSNTTINFTSQALQGNGGVTRLMAAGEAITLAKKYEGQVFAVIHPKTA